MTPTGLCSICTPLFGRNWQTALARFLRRDDGTHVSPRTVRRWASGMTPVPFWVEPLLQAEQARRAVAGSPR